MRSLTTRICSATLAASLVLLLSGCAANALRQARQADDLRDYDVAVAQYAKAVRQHPDNRDAQLGLERAKLRASDGHLLRGRRLYAEGRYEDAVTELQVAYDLNPTNGDAERDLRGVRAALRAQLAAPAEGQTRLESLLDRAHELTPPGPDLPDVKLPASITTGRQTTSRDLYLMIGSLADISVTFDSTFRESPAPVSLLNNMTVRQALDAVARSTNTFYQVTAPSTITVIPDTPAKRREYTDEVEAVFYVRNADLKETMDALRVVSDMRAISAISGTNAILARDTPDRIRVAGRFLSAFDKARPEVVVDVEVLEVNRTKLREYGAQIASPGSAGIDGAADVNTSGLTLQSLKSLSAADVMISNLPALYYRLLKTDSNTRTLANPHLRMSDGVAAHAGFGEEIPVPQTTFPLAANSQTGSNPQPVTQYAYRTIGVNLTLTPRTHPNDEVTLSLEVELSSLSGTGYAGIPTFGSRAVTTTLRLKDGETNILAGLIRDDERSERTSIPGLGDVPVLGHLFARNHREAQQTDVVIMLTPHIVRVLDLDEEDLRPLRLPREGAGPSLMETSPIVPGPIIRGGGGGDSPMPPSFPVTAGVPTGLPLAPLAPPVKVIKN
jgi:general secretion pathway protein D